MRRGETVSTISAIICAGVAAALPYPFRLAVADALRFECRMPQQMEKALVRHLCNAVRTGVEARLRQGAARPSSTPQIVFEVTRYRVRSASGSMAGRLRWSAGTGRQGWRIGQEVSATITDAPFDTVILGQFARTIAQTGDF
ncbi:hypothetical protein [Neorhizobium sp. NCHU2750]|uniref:hypothetical protein n=1 Tax=Neorhizobium sp. NCHU2750 TaxID=1825976 RepID=UPI0013C5260F